MCNFQEHTYWDRISDVHTSILLAKGFKQHMDYPSNFKVFDVDEQYDGIDGTLQSNQLYKPPNVMHYCILVVRLHVILKYKRWILLPP